MTGLEDKLRGGWSNLTRKWLVDSPPFWCSRSAGQLYPPPPLLTGGTHVSSRSLSLPRALHTAAPGVPPHRVTAQSQRRPQHSSVTRPRGCVWGRHGDGAPGDLEAYGRPKDPAALTDEIVRAWQDSEVDSSEPRPEVELTRSPSPTPERQQHLKERQAFLRLNQRLSLPSRLARVGRRRRAEPGRRRAVRGGARQPGVDVARLPAGGRRGGAGDRAGLG